MHLHVIQSAGYVCSVAISVLPRVLISGFRQYGKASRQEVAAILNKKKASTTSYDNWL